MPTIAEQTQHMASLVKGETKLTFGDIIKDEWNKYDLYQAPVSDFMQEQTYKDEITGQTDRRYMTELELSQSLHTIQDTIDSIRRFMEDGNIEQVNKGIRIIRNRVVALSEIKKEMDAQRKEMAERAWQTETWDGHRINNVDAIMVYGFKSRIDMEKAWQEAGLMEKEAQYKHQIGEPSGMRG